MPFYPNWFDPPLKAMLYASTMPVDFGDKHLADLSGHEATGTNVGVKDVTGAFVVDGGQATKEGDNLVWSSLTSPDIRYVVFYEDTGDPSTDRLFAFVDLVALGFSGAITNDTLTLVFNANGFYKVVL